MSVQETIIYKRWLHYIEIGDEKKKRETVDQWLHFLTNKEDGS